MIFLGSLKLYEEGATNLRIISDRIAMRIDMHTHTHTHTEKQIHEMKTQITNTWPWAETLATYPFEVAML